MRHDGPVNFVGFVPGRSLLFSASDDGTVRSWDGKPRAQQFSAGSPVLRLAFTSDGDLMAAGWKDGSVRVWNVNSNQPMACEIRHKASIKALSFGPIGNTLVTGSDDGTVQIWDPMTCTAVEPPPMRPCSVGRAER